MAKELYQYSASIIQIKVTINSYVHLDENIKVNKLAGFILNLVMTILFTLAGFLFFVVFACNRSRVCVCIYMNEYMYIC